MQVEKFLVCKFIAAAQPQMMFSLTLPCALKINQDVKKPDRLYTYFRSQATCSLTVGIPFPSADDVKGTPGIHRQ